MPIGIKIGLSMAGGRSSAGITYLLRDTFTDTDGTLLTAHTMNVGSGWTKFDVTHVWDIQTNRSRETSVQAGAGIQANSGVTDHDVSVTMAVDGANNSGPVSRYVDANNFALLSRLGVLYIFVAGTPTNRGSAVVTPAAGDVYRMKWVGSSVTCYKNGVSIITYTLTAGEVTAIGAGTKCGMRANLDGTVRFDVFAVVASS